MHTPNKDTLKHTQQETARKACTHLHLQAIHYSVNVFFALCVIGLAQARSQTHTWRNYFVWLVAVSSEIQPSISPNQRPGEQAT